MLKEFPVPVFSAELGALGKASSRSLESLQTGQHGNAMHVENTGFKQGNGMIRSILQKGM